ncbi:MAG: hypothetical protein D3905_13780 [Candidatus Electrothrix sp. AS4_5]|nr:hypothetical protein [Candidatus Electrothrix gigas]
MFGFLLLNLLFGLRDLCPTHRNIECSSLLDKHFVYYIFSYLIININFDPVKKWNRSFLMLWERGCPEFCRRNYAETDP